MNTDEKVLHVVRELAPIWKRIERNDRALAVQGRRALMSAALQYAEGLRARGGNKSAKLQSAYAEACEARFAVKLAEAAGLLPTEVAELAVEQVDGLAAILYVKWKRPLGPKSG